MKSKQTPSRQRQKRPSTHYTRHDIPRLRALLQEDRGWTLEQFAFHLGQLCGKPKGYSAAYLKRLANGERTFTRKIALALRQMERDEAYYYREIVDENTETLGWMVEGIERRKEELTAEMKKRLERLLRKTKDINALSAGEMPLAE